MKVTLPRIFISAPHKSSGKTTLTLGLARAFQDAGTDVQCFKKGPDYIDPMWHKAATGRASYNLDPFMMKAEVIIDSFSQQANHSGINLIEGNHGLHDGLAEDGSNSSAGLALMLDAPVLLVVDVTGTNRGIAANVLGQMLLEPKLKIAAVILNKVASKRQEKKQRSAIEQYCKIPVVGAIPNFDASKSQLAIKERHLGLITTEELDCQEELIHNMAELVKKYCDLEQIAEIARGASPFSATVAPVPAVPAPVVPMGNEIADKKRASRVKLGVIQDQAFCFYYPENLEALEKAGAELIYINSMEEAPLPEIDGLYIGGGFPESFLPQLEANKKFRRALAKKIQDGLPAYVECGGLIYCAEKASYQGQEYDLLGVLQGTINFFPKPVGYGYMELEVQQEGHWLQNEAKEAIKGHEFHYSSLEEAEHSNHQLFKVKRGVGLGKGEDGILQYNLVASYAHIHALATPWWAINFVHFIEKTLK